MVAVAKRLVVVIEKRIMDVMRYDREEEEGGWDDLCESETCIVSRGCKVYLFYTNLSQVLQACQRQHGALDACA
jgi:hypothetical protein